jgi:hypothetical protein
MTLKVIFEFEGQQRKTLTGILNLLGKCFANADVFHIPTHFDDNDFIEEHFILSLRPNTLSLNDGSVGLTVTDTILLGKGVLLKRISSNFRLPAEFRKPSRLNQGAN